MRIKKGVIIQEMGEEFILIDLGTEQPIFNGMIRLNKTGKEIIEMLIDNDLNEDEIVAKLKEKYDATEDILHQAVQNVIKEISKTPLFIK